jgi:hypothetical protein
MVEAERELIAVLLTLLLYPEDSGSMLLRNMVDTYQTARHFIQEIAIFKDSECLRTEC